MKINIRDVSEIIIGDLYKMNYSTPFVQKDETFVCINVYSKDDYHVYKFLTKANKRFEYITATNCGDYIEVVSKFCDYI